MRFVPLLLVVLGFAVPLDTEGQTSCESCTLSFNSESLNPVEISCSDGNPLSALPNFPAFTTTCTSGYWASIFKHTTGSSTSCVAVRAGGLTSSLGTIQLQDFTATGLTSTNKFNESTEGLTWTVYPENVARLQGTVINANNVNARFEVDLYFNQGTSGAAWTAAGGNVNDNAATSDEVAEWTVWQIKPHISKLVGAGDLAGEVVYLETSNLLVSYPFQEGFGANGINGGLGLGGSFDWISCVEGTIYGGYGVTSTDFTSCEESTSICASDNDAVAEYFIGNLESFDQIQGSVNVTDNTPPVLGSLPPDYLLNCPVELAELDAEFVVTASDDCSTASLSMTESFSNGACPSEFTRTRTYTATDGCGLTSSHVQTVEVVDQVAPSLTVPANVTFSCSEGPTFATAFATDACDGILQVTEDEPTTVEGDCPGEYTVYRTFSATDLCGNTSTGQQTVFVRDNTPPVLQMPEDVVLPCGSSFVYPIAIATDNCTEQEDISISIFNSLPPTNCPQEYILERRFLATDLCGNSILEIQTVTVTDGDLPYFTFVPADATYSCDEDPVFEDAVADDDCSSYEITTSLDTVFQGCDNNYDLVRTFVVTDACGNFAEATQTLSIRDNIAPTILSELTNPTVECTEVWEPSSLLASDNCSEVSLSTSIDTVGVPSTGAYSLHVVHVAADDCGNSAQATQTVTVVDSTPPVFTSVPEDLILSCEDEIPFEAAVAADMCSSVSIEISEELELGVSLGLSVLSRTFTATDAQGNTTSATQIITIQDATAPEFTYVPADYNVECSDDMPLDIAAATDNCGTVTIDVSSETTPSDAVGNYVVTRTFTATDDAGNSASATQTITVQDTTPPEFTFVPADYTVECSDVMPLNDATAADNCGTATVTVASETTPGNASSNYTITRTFTATDDAGNSASATQTITVQDTTAPEFTFVPADYSAECSDNMPMDEATTADNCGTVTIDVSNETTPGNAAGNYTITRTFTATDDAGNSASASQTITVQDTTAPEFTFVPADYIAECSDDMPMDDATASDNCGSVTIDVASETTPGNAAGNYTIARTFTATDDAGNSASATQTITVQDTTAPALIVPADYTVECSEGLSLDPAQAIDNCGTTSISVVVETIPGIGTGNYIVTRTFTATDDAGNSASATQTITVEDTTPPSLSIPEDYTVECSAGLVLDPAEAVDNCGTTSISVVVESTAGNATGNYVVTRTFTATDDAGNSVSATQTITVQDTTAPEFTFVPADYTAECSDDMPMDDATAADNCGTVTLDVASETTPGDAAGNYVVVRTFTAVDDAGNSSTATQIITVQDTTAPEFTFVPDDYTAECSDDMPMDDATAADNCGEVTIDVTSETTPGNAVGNYILTRTFTATDDAGNSSTATQTITVQDTTAPALIVPADYTVECSDDIPLDDATATDNCGMVTLDVVSETIPGDAAGNYVTVRSFTATDDAGNSSSATQTITVQDTTAPEFTFVPESQFVECTEELSLESPQVSDLCSAVSLAEVTDTLPGLCSDLVTLVRTFTATDESGNQSVVTQTLTQVDTQGPTFDLIEEVNLSCSQNLNAVPIPTVNDACSEVPTLIWNDLEVSGGCALPVSAVVRTYTAIDACGNVSTAEQMIQLTDTVAPVWEFAPEDVTLDCSESFEFVPAVASDNCAAPSVTWSVDTLGDVSTGVYQVVFTFLAVDDCDNASEHEQVVNVVDTVEPMWDDFPADQVMSCDGDLDGSMPSASDACSDSVIVTLVSEEFFPGECEGSGNWVRTFSATDWNGNVLTSSQTVAVVDDVAPEFVSIPEDVVIECDEPMPTSMATASDNCSEPLVELSESLTDVINDGNYTLLRTFTATDACGNATSATQTVQVVDTIAPVILTELVDMTVECDSDFSPLELQVTDACSSVVEVSVTDVETPGACDGEWTVQRTYVVMDESGNADTTVVVLNVVDTTAPAWTAAPENITVSCDAPFPSNQAEAEDACSEVNVVLVQDTLLGNSEGNYQITQTWTATDACMNTSMWSRIVTVVDTAAPVVIYPADTTLACDQTIPVWEPLAGDNCGPIEWAFEDSVVSGNCPGNFSVVRHFTVTDDAGNESQGSQVISVVDNVAPSFSYVPDFEIWECNAPAELDSAVASDNCSGVELIANLDTLVGLGANQWTLMVTWTATDACGNSAQATQEIDVLDQLAPEIEAGPFDTTINWGEELLLDMWQNELVYSDSCSSQEELTVVVTTDTLPADTACLDQITLTWVVSDLAGNEAQWVQLIDLIDVDAPVWDAEPEDQTLACDEVWVPFYPEGSDHNVFSFTEALDTLAGACPAEFTITRTLVATDVCGNEALPWVQILTVVDTVAPIVDTWPADLVLTDPANVPDCESNALIWTDNCSDAVVDCATDTIEEFCPGSFLLERTYTVTDACGNVASVQQSILVEDVEEPVFEDLPNEVTYACDTTLSPPSIGELTITDNQSTTDEIVANVLELDSEGDECSSFTTFRYTAMDGCGNMTEVFYTQIREDNDAPVLTTPLEDLEFTCLGEVPSFDDQMFLLDVEDCQSPADGGPGYDVGLVATAVDEFEGGDCTGPDCLLTRTITVDDNCGNVAMFEQVIVVSEPPTVPELPTGFSPNNDSFNDVYRIRNAGPDLGLPPCDWLDNTTFTVFDRWGSVVYLSNDVSIPWDGTNISGRPLPVGTYFVVFEANGLTYRATVDLRR